MVKTSSNDSATTSSNPAQVSQPQPVSQAEREVASGPLPTVEAAVQTDAEAAPGLSPNTGASNPETSPSVPTARRVWRSGDPYQPSPHRDGNHWEKIYKKVDGFDKEFCSGWNSEIDSLLTFAGLFSAVVTAFTVESYKLLQPDPQDMTNQILLNLTARLTGGNASALTSESFTPSPSSLRINTLWFLSLTFSLTAGLVGILCKQWLRHYQQDISKPPKEALFIRQFRYDAFLQCRVMEILSALPVLLGLGLILFFAGLIDFLRGLNVTVLIPVTVLIGAGFAFLAVTTLTPAIQYVAFILRGPYTPHPASFAFKSPQSLAILHLVTWLPSMFPKNSTRPFSESRDLTTPNWTSLELGFFPNWYSPAYWTYAGRAFAWLDETYSHSSDMVRQICFCLQDCEDMSSPFAGAFPLGMEEAQLWDFANDSKSSAAVIKSFFEETRLVVDISLENGHDIWSDIIAIRYLSPSHHDSVSEHIIRALNSSHHQVSLSRSLSESLWWPVVVASRWSGQAHSALVDETTWQRAMLFRNLLSEGRLKGSSAEITREVENVFGNLKIFTDGDLDSIFSALRPWVDRDPWRVDLPSYCWVTWFIAQPELHKSNETLWYSHRPPVRDFMAFLDSRFQMGDGIEYFSRFWWHLTEETLGSFFKLVYAWIERNPQDTQSFIRCRTSLASMDSLAMQNKQSFQEFEAFLEAQIARSGDIAEPKGAVRNA